MKCSQSGSKEKVERKTFEGSSLIVLRGGFPVLWSSDTLFPRIGDRAYVIGCTILGDLMFKRVVAVIEDDPSLRTSLGHLLRAHGYACETCASAEEFLDHFEISRASCVLVDINLGDGLSGIELCKRLRASGRSLNVIVMTGVDIRQNEIEATDAGCDAYLHKPISSHTLIDAIEKRAPDPI